MLKEVIRSVRELAVSESGPTTVEYAVMITLIIAVCLVAIHMLGISVRDIFFFVAGPLAEVAVDNGI